jgi:hypothetical protein
LIDLSSLRALARSAIPDAELGTIERLDPWCVARVELNSSRADAPRSVIVKWLRNNEARFRTDPSHVLTEIAALAFLDTLNVGLAPRLLAADAERHVIVMSDLSPRVPLFDIVRTSNEGWQSSLLAYARTMGELHASTAGHAADYYVQRRSLGPVDEQRDRKRVMAEPSWTLPNFDTYGIHTTRHIDAETAKLHETLLASDAFLAFSNGDAGANNFLVAGTDGRIIDFESAGYRHALIDAACLHVPGPMWMTVADPVPLGAVDAYRRALANGVSAATDDRAFATGMAAACMMMAIERLERLPVLDARPADHHSKPQMISTLESAARAAEHYRSLPALAQWARDAAYVLRRRWPEADIAFPDGFTTRE